MYVCMYVLLIVSVKKKIEIYIKGFKEIDQLVDR